MLFFEKFEKYLVQLKTAGKIHFVIQNKERRPDEKYDRDNPAAEIQPPYQAAEHHPPNKDECAVEPNRLDEKRHVFVEFLFQLQLVEKGVQPEEENKRQ